MRRPRPPQGVRLHVRGQEIACIVRRAPHEDANGEIAWAVIPDEPVTIYPDDLVHIHAVFQPGPAAMLFLDLDLDLGEAG